MARRYPDEARAAARTAYTRIEPLHVVAYFNPEAQAASEGVQADPRAWYFGVRAQPMGEAAPAVVAAAFHSFNPVMVDRVWPRVLKVGLETLAGARTEMLDRALRTAFGELVDSPDLPALVDAISDLNATLPLGGRPLGAAWAEAPATGIDHVDLWQELTILREWRGDGHIAVLNHAGLGRVEAIALHLAEHPDPPKGHVGGPPREQALKLRDWSESDWQDAVAALVERGLIEPAGGRLSEAGVELIDELEAATDDAAAYPLREAEARELLERLRPFTKAVLASGFLPWVAARGGS